MSAALDGACCDLGITASTIDLKRRQAVLQVIADLVLGGDHDAGSLRRQAVTYFQSNKP
jgi:hypothetical protein